MYFRVSFNWSKYLDDGKYIFGFDVCCCILSFFLFLTFYIFLSFFLSFFRYCPTFFLILIKMRWQRMRNWDDESKIWCRSQLRLDGVFFLAFCLSVFFFLSFGYFLSKNIESWSWTIVPTKYQNVQNKNLTKIKRKKLQNQTWSKVQKVRIPKYHFSPLYKTKWIFALNLRKIIIFYEIECSDMNLKKQK